jgi:hypothetical protein
MEIDQAAPSNLSDDDSDAHCDLDAAGASTCKREPRRPRQIPALIPAHPVDSPMSSRMAQLNIT